MPDNVCYVGLFPGTGRRQECRAWLAPCPLRANDPAMTVDASGFDTPSILGFKVSGVGVSTQRRSGVYFEPSGNPKRRSRIRRKVPRCRNIGLRLRPIQ